MQNVDDVAQTMACLTNLLIVGFEHDLIVEYQIQLALSDSDNHASDALFILSWKQDYVQYV